MTQNTKQIITANVLAQRLKLRLASPFVVTQSFDASNNPCVLIQDTSGRIGTNNLLVQVTGSVSTYSNIIGGTEDFVSTPTVLNCYAEALTTTNSLGAAAISLYNTASFQSQYEIELAKTYAIQNVYAVNNAVTITVAALANTLLTSVTLVTTTVPELAPASGMAAG
jgi:hypothetical protein